MTQKTRKVLGQSALGVISGLLMMWLGYMLNDFLARAQIEIKDIEFHTPLTSFHAPLDQLERIHHADSIVYEFSRLIDPHRYINDVEVAEEEIDEYEDVILKLNSYSTDLEKKITRYLNLVRTDGNLHEVIDYLRLRDRYFPAIDDSDVDKAKAFLLETLETANTRAKVCVEATRVILTAIKEYKPKKNELPRRTGELTISVTFLNSGNSDGLVKEKGFLIYTTDGTRIPIRGFDTTIGKRSIGHVRFKVDNEITLVTLQDELKTHVVNRNPIPVTIEVYDNNHSPIVSGAESLTVTD